MNALTLPWLGATWKLHGSRVFGLAAAGLLALSGVSAFSQATVTTLGGDKGGAADSCYTYQQATFNFPAGIALDPSDTMLFLADYNNDAVRMVTQLGDRNNSFTYKAFGSAQGISHPIAVAVDLQTNVYVLNYGSGKNGTLMKFNGSDYANYLYLNTWTTNATQLTNATALALDYQTNAYVTVQSNTVIKISAANVATVVGVITNAGTYLRGIAVMDDGRLALSDAGNNGIWMMDPANTNLNHNAVKYTGFHGAGDQIGAASFASFNGPATLAKAGNGVLVVADYNNAKVKIVSTNGTVTRLFGVNPQYWYGGFPGWADGTVNPNEQQDLVQCRQPYGLAVAHDGTVYDTEDNYCLLREATGTGLPELPPPPPSTPAGLSVIATSYNSATLRWTTVAGASGYNVKWSPSSGGPYDTLTSVSTNTYTDTTVVNGSTNYYVVSAVNSGGIESADSTEAVAIIPVPPPPSPSIGWFDYEGGPPALTVFHPVSGTPYTSFNDLSLAIKPGINGVSTLFTTDGTNPLTTTNGSTPPYYADGLTFAQALPVNNSPHLVIKAVNIGPGR